MKMKSVSYGKRKEESEIQYDIKREKIPKKKITYTYTTSILINYLH